MIIKKDVHEQVGLNDFRQLIDTAANKYHKAAYKYKKNPEAKEPEYIEITYQQARKEIEAFATALLNMGLEKRK